jgi:putative intracellular protease/amidase
MNQPLGTHVLVICARRYNPHELYTVIDVLDARGYSPSIVSTDSVIQDMYTGEPFRATYSLETAGQYHTVSSGIIFVEGELKDTQVLWTDKTVLEVVASFNQGRRPIAAIGTAVPCIRLVSCYKQVSFFPLNLEMKDLLTKAGADPSGKTVTRDDNIVTGEHHQAARLVADEFCNLLDGAPWELVTHNSEFKPDGRKPRPVDLIDKIRRIREQKEHDSHSDQPST